MLNCAPQQMAIVKDVTEMNLGDMGSNRCVCVSVYCNAFQGECVEAEAATNTQRPHRSLIVYLHNKSNVSREIIYTRTVLNKSLVCWTLVFFLVCVAVRWCLRITSVCYLLAFQRDSVHDDPRVSFFFFFFHVWLWYSWGSVNLLALCVADVFVAIWMRWQREGKGKQINTNKSQGPFRATMCVYISKSQRVKTCIQRPLLSLRCAPAPW